MNFVFSLWESFCRDLRDGGRVSVTAREVLGGTAQPYVVLKHDVETDVKKAHRMASIEQQYGHRASYYVQAYLLDDADNIALLKEMQAMGHEISYHYDVMDSAKGDLALAMEQYEENVKRFEENGFSVVTVCQHGNPVVERVGYTSNRDFFRSEAVQQRYAHMTDIMVDFPRKSGTTYRYFSDAGRCFQWIYDPFENDIVNSDDQNKKFEDLRALMAFAEGDSCIISTHPHRYEASIVKYRVRTALFKVIRTTAKLLLRVPGLKKLMSRYYYLAKKI